MSRTSSARLSRRAFLAGASATLAAGPAFAQSGATSVDVAIIGGGAAGIAAARQIAESGRSYVVLEAAARLGGRARTVSALGLDVDLGCGAFTSRFEPLPMAAEAANIMLEALPGPPRLYVDRRDAPQRDYDDFLVALGQARRDIRAAASAGRDVAASTVLTAQGGSPGPWRETVAALLGPLSCGRGLDALSTVDLARRAPLLDDVTSPTGVGRMLETLGAWLNVQTGAEVSLITNAGRLHTIALRGRRGVIRARAIILAVPAPVIASGAIRFNPPLPARLATAFRDLPVGAIEQVAFLLPGNPLQLEADERVLPRAAGTPFSLRARVNGSDLHILTFGGEPARAIARDGSTAALELARTAMAQAFGTEPGTITQVAASAWTADPLIRGALVAAAPGKGTQRTLFEGTVQNRIFLAGEYASPDGWGTLAGAWASGEAASARALRLLGGPA